MEKYIDILSKVALFNNIEKEKIPTMLECLKCRKKSYRKGTYICYEGDDADFIGIILSGNIQIIQEDIDGRRNITATFGAGNMFAEAFVCAGMQYLPVSIFAHTDCEILFIDKNQILNQQDGACNFHAKLTQNLLRIVAKRNIMLSQKLRYLSHKTTAEKLMAYLNDQAKLNNSTEFTIPFDRQALADYLGVDRSAMSAEISKLKKSGVIDTNKSYFRIL